MLASIASDSNGNLCEVACPICRSERSSFVYNVHDDAFQVTNESFGVRRCRECGCGYLSPRPTKDEIGKYYTKHFYWSFEGSNQALSWEDIIDKRRAQLESKALWLDDVGPGRLLDIGAQKGEFLWMMRQRGWQVEGTELDNAVPNPANMPIRYGDFLAMDFEPSGYDCITMWAVLEHVYEPGEIIRKVAELLRPGGRLIALVTNFDSIQGRLLRMDDYPRHLTMFTKGSMRRLCSNHGLELVRITTDQKIFSGRLNGGMVYGLKRLFGYSEDEVFREWKQMREPELFCCRWKGRSSALIHTISRVDRLLSMPFEKALDRLGYGFILTVSARKT